MFDMLKFIRLNYWFHTSTFISLKQPVIVVVTIYIIHNIIKLRSCIINQSFILDLGKYVLKFPLISFLPSLLKY